MTETQLFYLSIMVGLFVLYLIVSKICDTFEIKYKSLAMAKMKIMNISEEEEIKKKLIQALDNQEVNIDNEK